MPEQNIKTLIEENDDPFEFNFQNYLEKGFAVCSQFAIGFIGFYFLFFLITMTVGNFGSFGEILNRTFITPILSVGPYFVAQQIYRKQPFHFDQFWLGFKEALPLAILAVFQLGAYLLILSPFTMSEHATLINQWFLEWQADPMGMTSFPSIPTWYVLLLLPIFYLAVSWAYAPLFIVFRGLTPWQAMEASRKMVARKWLTIAGFLIVLGIVIFSGVLFFGVGILFTLPMSACMLYVSWADWVEHFEIEEQEDPMKDLMDAF